VGRRKGGEAVEAFRVPADYPKPLGDVLWGKGEAAWRAGKFPTLSDGIRHYCNTPAEVEAARRELRDAWSAALPTCQSAEASDGKRPHAQALADAYAFKALFPPSCYVVWAIAGSVRRLKPFVGDIEHVVRPALADEPVAGNLFGQLATVNLLWRRCDELLAAGTIAKHIYPVQHADGTTGETTRWGERYRGCEFRGFNHEIFTTDEAGFGSIYCIRTGPAEFSHQLQIRLAQRGYQNREGHVWSLASGEMVPVPDERDYLRLAGLPWIEPQDRRDVLPAATEARTT
jgi:hypothetical protein